MTTALTISPQNMTELERYAVAVAKSNLYGLNPDQALVVAMAGRDLGLSYPQAVRAFHIIKGKPVMSADGMVAVCLGKPEVCEYFRTVESTDAVCTVETKRRGNPEPRKMSYTIDMAKRAGLNTDNWKSRPDAMLRARAKTALARDVYPDLLLGIYAPEEMDDAAPLGDVTVRPAPAHEVVDAEIVDANPAHHASWAKDRAGFCAKLGDLGIKYEDCAAFCADKGMQRPSTLTSGMRQKLIERLGNGGRAAFDAFIAARNVAAFQAANAETACEPGDDTDAENEGVTS